MLASDGYSRELLCGDLPSQELNRDSRSQSSNAILLHLRNNYLPQLPSLFRRVPVQLHRHSDHLPDHLRLLRMP
jgi:hypothetical protein